MLQLAFALLFLLPNDFRYRITTPDEKPPEVPAVRISGSEPRYPEAARKARIEGSVLLELTIEKDGRVSGGRVIKPLPFGLTEAAVEAVRTWKFKPARTRGRPVRSKQTVRLEFHPPR